MASHSDPMAANAEVATSVNAEAAAAAVNVEAVAVAEATAQPIVNANDYLLQQQLQLFWAAQLQEIMQIGDFKGHSLPIFRIKKIMKSDKEVRMISAESPILLDKALSSLFRSSPIVPGLRPRNASS
ncbi:nuclear transcription factor Y subunit C-2-like [Solanum lycopersicum]|uniref:nuclear transcription factor Y subunit C-2-like n=1 Tax=Solanum lycopersicum TaxID=4081 RepID=UPI00374A3C3B